MEGPRFVWPRRDRNTRVALIGLPGSGKSAVAPLLARRLRCPSLDLDAAVERRAGRSVTSLFEEGEATFRGLETLELEEALRGEGPLVLACGGGVLLRSENRALLGARARVVLLEVDPETAAVRLRGAGAAERPVLQGRSPVERLRALLSERGPAYAAAADAVVNTTGLTPEEVADRIAERLTVA